MQDYSKFKCPWISKKEIWELAEDFRSEFWPANTLPVDIETIIERRLRLNIEPEHNLLTDQDIDAYLRSDLTGIVVDHDCFMDERFSNRLRFSYSHELAHLQLHKEMYAQLSISDLEDWRNFMSNVPDREYGYFEYQANEFAGRVLVPRDILKHELEDCLRQIEEHGLLRFSD